VAALASFVAGTPLSRATTCGYEVQNSYNNLS